MNRREFVSKTAATAALSIISPVASFSGSSSSALKIALIGIGARGTDHLQVILRREDVVVTALCDIDSNALKKAQQMVQKANQKKPVLYGAGELDYKNLLEKEDIDGVIISTPWVWHTRMATDAMRAGVATGLEVAGAFSIEECWDLVDAYEATQVPFMILENVCYRRDVMAVLNMAREGLFGEIVHLQGGYQHDLRAVKFNDGKQLYGGGVEFGEKGYSEARWRTEHSVKRNGDLYPTHGLGPVGTYIDLNRGNRLVSLTSTSSKSRGLHDYVVNQPGGREHPSAKVEFALGDIVTTVIKCANGESIVLTHDTSLPRPYSLGFRVQGTKGIWMDVNNSIHIEGISTPHEWENADEYMKKYDHPLWKKYETDTVGAGHGGMDFFVINAFVEALKQKKDMPLDVYDCVSWASVTCLSERSIAKGSEPQEFPDFTNGKWISRKPIFGFGDSF